MRLRRDLKGFLGYGAGGPVWGLIPSTLVFLETVRFPGVGSILLAVPFVAFYALWLSGRVVIADGFVVAGSRFRPERTRLSGVVEITDASVRGRDVVPRIGLMLESGEMVHLQLTGALTGDRRELWKTGLEAAVARAKA